MNSQTIFVNWGQAFLLKDGDVDIEVFPQMDDVEGFSMLFNKPGHFEALKKERGMVLRSATYRIEIEVLALEDAGVKLAIKEM